MAGHKPKNLSLGEVPQFSDEREVECKKAIFWQKIEHISETVRYRAKKLQLSVCIKLYIPYRLVTYSMTSDDL